MSSNAWDRAQRAISRAEERDAAVVTPDNAVSPFDASATTVIPHADLPGARGRHQRPEDATTEVHAPADGPRPGRRRRPSPRPNAEEPPTAPVELAAEPAERPGTDEAGDTDGYDGYDPADDAPTESVATTPGPPARPRVALRARPDTAPFEAVGTASGGYEGAGGASGPPDRADRADRADPEVVEDADPPRRGFWARLFRRR